MDILFDMRPSTI